MCRSRGSGASRSPHPTSCEAIRFCRFRGRMISAPTYFERSELTPQSLRDSSPAGEPMAVLILYILCRSRGSGASGSPQPTSCEAIRFCRFRGWMISDYYSELLRYSLCGRMISAPTYFERSELTPQSLRDSSPAGEPMGGFVWRSPHPTKSGFILIGASTPINQQHSLRIFL